ncbi:MAG: TolB family protein, partial [Halobacteriaceae archaeon]
MVGSTTDSPRQVEPETLARLPEFYAPRLSPDGDELAFFHDKSGRMELYSISLEEGEWNQWSNGNVPRDLSGNIEWGKDGNVIYFHQDEGGNEQNDIYAIDRDGTTSPVVEIDGQARLCDVDRAGESLLYASDEGDQLNVYHHNLKSDETLRITDHDDPVWPFSVSFSPDGNRIAYVTNERDDPQNRDVYVKNVDGETPRRLEIGEIGTEAAVVDWFPDGNRLLIGDNTKNYDRVGIYDLESDDITWLSDGTAVERPGSVSPDGSLVAVGRTREAATVTGIYDVKTGEWSQLDLPEGVTRLVGRFGGGFRDNSTLLLVHQTGSERKHIVQY